MSGCLSNGDLQIKGTVFSDQFKGVEEPIFRLQVASFLNAGSNFQREKQLRKLLRTSSTLSTGGKGCPCHRAFFIKERISFGTNMTHDQNKHESTIPQIWQPHCLCKCT